MEAQFVSHTLFTEQTSTGKNFRSRLRFRLRFRLFRFTSYYNSKNALTSNIFCAFHKRNAALLVKDSDDEAEDGENGDGDHDEDDENVDGLNKRRRFEEGKIKYRGLTLMRKNMQSP